MNRSLWRSVVYGGLFAMAMILFTLQSSAQQTLGSLNGTVVDATGAAVTGATVKVTNAAINVTATTTTQKTGFFQIFNLPIGTYSLSVSHDGFETTQVSGIGVQESQAKTINVTLKVGKASESVEVTANPMLNATDTTNGYTLDTKQIEITPLATGSFTQLAVLSPGVNAELLSNLDSNSGLGNQPIWANGQRDTSNTFQVNGVDATNLFNGKSSSGSTSQRYNWNIGGGSTSQTSSAGTPTIGGGEPVGTSVYGSNGNSLPSPPPEFLQELRVNTSMYDAQQGATSGAQIDANTATGSNNWHGGLYGSFANNNFNASPFFFNQEYQLTAQDNIGAFPASLGNPYLQRWTVGGTAGGPVLKNKVFVFLGYQHRANRDEGTGLSQLTVPSGLTDDRSTAGIDAAVVSYGAKAPASIDPIAMALLNAKLPNGSFLIPSAQSSAPYFYGVPNVNLIGTSTLAADQATASVDYDMTHADRISAKYYYQNDPVNKPYGFAQTGGFPVSQDNGSQVLALDNTTAIGSRLNWEQRLGIDRMYSYSYYTQTLTNPGGASNFGIGATGSFGTGLPGLLLKSFPSSQLDSPALKVGPYSSFADMGYYQNRMNPSTNVIFAIGKHTIVAGGGYSYTQLNIENNRNGDAQIATKNFSKFVTGAVSSSSVLESTDSQSGRNDADRYYRTNEASAYVQDKWQVQSNLSITAGVRYDLHGGMTEKFGNMFNFDPSLYSVTGNTTNGFTVNNAGFVIAGNNKYDATHGVSASTLTGRQWGISPRLGFAYSPKVDHGTLVVRGGFGIYYDRGELFSYLSQPAGSGNGGPFGVTESAPLASYVVGNGKTLENPLGTALTGAGYVPPSSDPSTINKALQSVLSRMAGPTGQSADFGPNCGGVDNQEGYTDCPDTLNFGAYDKTNVLPYTMNYTFNVQYQPTNSWAITVGYTGNRGRHAVVPIPLNEPGIATPSNPIWGETSTYGFEVLNANSFNGYDYNPIAVEPWNTEDGGNTDFRAPYVGYSPNAVLFKTVGNSAYDALESHVEKRLSNNYQLGASYTYSHSLDEQSDIGIFFTGNDPKNLKSSWASSDFDRTNVFSANFQVNSPKLVKDKSAASYIANDWHLTGIGVLQSGEPYSLYEFYGAVGSLNFGNYPTLMNPVLGIKDPRNPKTALTGNKGPFRASGGSYIPVIDPTQIAINYITPGTNGVPVSTGTDPQDIYETGWAPGQRNLFRQAPQKRLDLSVRKNVQIKEKLDLQFEFNVFNVTNTTSLDVPLNTAQIRQNSACSAKAVTADGGYDNCGTSNYYVNYGQIATSNSPTDQASALARLDQVPYTNGTGKGLTVPLQIPVGAQGTTCIASEAITAFGTNGCPNNGSTFGSVLGTIGGSRAITFGVHFNY
jgi:hypothetical protein